MSRNKPYGNLAMASGLSIALVVLLFLFSERQVHRNNAFTRRYPPHPIIKEYDLDIGFNSYYIAGFDNEHIYLGNRTAQWHLLRVNLKSRDTAHIQLEPQNKELQYRSLKIGVLPPYFFMMDGTMPFILRGKLGDWIAEPWMEGVAYFNRALPLDSNRIFIRTTHARTQRSTLGLIEKTDAFKVTLDTTLLEQQIDGVFDVDGTMVSNWDNSKLGYVYFYRNQFMTMDSGLKHIKRQRTIDTVKRAHISVAQENRAGRIQMQAPPLTINKAASMYNEFMMVQSDRLGRNESKDMLDQASIIDVYNYKKGTYEFSLYLYQVRKEKAREFAIHGNQLVALIGNSLSVYNTVELFFNSERANLEKNSKDNKNLHAHVPETGH